MQYKLICSMLVVSGTLAFLGLERGAISVIPDEDLSSSLGAAYIHGQVLKSQQCNNIVPGEDDGCYRVTLSVTPHGSTFDCRGGCGDVCVGDGITKYCAPQCGEICDNTDEQGCNGDLYTEPTGWFDGCYLVIVNCSHCDYNMTGSC